jgi:hypothetical protein
MAEDSGRNGDTPHTLIMRDEILRLLEVRPYQPFEINLENGDRIVVEHPENLMMGPGQGSGRFANRLHVIGSSEVLFCTSLEKVTSVAEIDTGAPLGGSASPRGKN